MNTEFKDIDKRYDLFWLGMKYEKENNFQQVANIAVWIDFHRYSVD